MHQFNAPPLLERPYKSGAPLYVCLSIAGGIGLVGLMALGAASLRYTPLLGGCPDNAWPAVATVIALLTMFPAGIFVIAALLQIPLVWANGSPDALGRAVVAGLLTALLAAVFGGVVLIWLDALAGADCVEKSRSFLDAQVRL